MHSTQIRLTRRGKVVLGALLLGLAFTLFSLGRTTAKASDTSSSRPAVTSTTVGTGESLWSVSTRLWPRSDPRDGVAALAKANHLQASKPLAVGAVLRVP